MRTRRARRAADPAKNLKAVELVPVIPKYAGTGCHVHYVAAPGEFTFARVMHDGSAPVLAAFRGQAVEGRPEWLSRSCPSWPHVFMRTSSSHERILEGLHANHIHAVGGDWIAPLAAFARMVGIAFVGS